MAFVRALLSEPDVLFLDEASSALDAETEQALYELVMAELPLAAIISIAHRDIVARYHQVHWRFEADSEARFRISTSGLIKAGKVA